MPATLPPAHSPATRDELLRRNAELARRLAQVGAELDALQRELEVERSAGRRLAAAEKAARAEMLDVAAREQRRIGQELHDSTGQELTALGLLAETLLEVLPEECHTERPLVVKMVDGLKRALAQVRALSRGLIPVEVDAGGLMAALKELARRADGAQGVRCVFTCRGQVLVENNQIATHLYRIAQEAVANGLRHSDARHVTIVLEENAGAILLQVQDDGRGMPAEIEEGHGMGLRIMSHRAGLIDAQLSIEPAVPRGTVVTCRLQKDSIHGQEKRQDDDPQGESGGRG